MSTETEQVIRDVAKVREEIGVIRTVCDLRRMYPAGMGPGPFRELLLRLVTQAEDVLQRHSYDAIWDRCDFHEYGTQDSDWPCAEVRAVLKAWLP